MPLLSSTFILPKKINTDPCILILKKDYVNEFTSPLMLMLLQIVKKSMRMTLIMRKSINTKKLVEKMVSKALEF